MKLLVIDDNAAVRTTLRMLLRRSFGEVTAVGDPKLIPALLREGDVDAVLLDMNFTSDTLDGSEGLFWLSRIKEMADAPAVVVITAFGDIPLAVEAMKIGAEDFVSKPWDNEELKAKILRAVERNRSSRRATASVERAREIERHEEERENMTLEEMKMSHVSSMIERCGGNISLAAERLGVNRQTLYNFLRKKQ